MSSTLNSGPAGQAKRGANYLLGQKSRAQARLARQEVSHLPNWPHCRRTTDQVTRATRKEAIVASAVEVTNAMMVSNPPKRHMGDRTLSHDADRFKVNGNHAGTSKSSGSSKTSDSPWKNIGSIPRDPKSRARSREYLKQCVTQCTFSSGRLLDTETF